MHPDTLGWTAAALMVATFSCRDARRLRPLAVATNLAFIGYGLAAQLPPVLALHLLLLPINLWRWAQALAGGTPHGRSGPGAPAQRLQRGDRTAADGVNMCPSGIGNAAPSSQASTRVLGCAK